LIGFHRLIYNENSIRNSSTAQPCILEKSIAKRMKIVKIKINYYQSQSVRHEIYKFINLHIIYSELTVNLLTIEKEKIIFMDSYPLILLIDLSVFHQYTVLALSRRCLVNR
jgi:hypothetical protein